MHINEKIVLVGGGGGVYQIARYLKRTRPNITTVQTIFDHGGHSGKLRDERGMLPPGDICRAVLALADESLDVSLRELLSFRFPCTGSSVDNATFGNITFAALDHIYGGPIQAIEAMSKIFRVKGRILPVSLDDADLCAKLSDGSVIKGEGLIDTRPLDDDREIVSVHLSPEANIYTGTYEALSETDKIVFCPGGLFTSIIPNVLTAGFREAIQCGSAQLIYVMNIMTEKTETNRYTASMFASKLLEYLGVEKFDTVVCNSGNVSDEILAQYSKEKAEPVKLDMYELSKYARKIIVEDLLDQAGRIVRHSPRTASIIARI